METTKKTNTFWQDMARPVVVLIIICLVASALLGAVNATTKPVIEENNRITAELTRKAALPAASSFEELPVSDELAAMGVTGIYKGDNDTGYVVTASNKGYGGDVIVTVGFDAAGTILNVDANVSTETVGVGSKVGERAILDKFTGLSGTDSLSDPLRSGASYTSRAVRTGVDGAIAAVAELIG